MNKFIDQDGSLSCSSACATSWERIYSAGRMSKKKIKSDAWRSAVHRHPGECGKILSAKTLNRKRESAAKIEKYQKAAQKYAYLSENWKAKVTKKDGLEFVLVRKNGKFTGERVNF